MSNPTAQDFTDNLNTSFNVQLENGERLDLELYEVVHKVAEANEQSGMERFSIFFRGPASSLLGQRTYELVHQRLGTLQIFLVPISKDEQGFKYEAVFNRFLS